MNLNQVTISVADVERSVLFYQQLGLQLIVKSLPHYARFLCPAGDATFSLHLDEQEIRSGAVWIYFETDHLDEKVNELISKGIVFEELPADQPWLWRESRLKDPDGHLIILYYAGENRKDPPWRINTDEALSS